MFCRNIFLSWNILPCFLNLLCPFPSSLSIQQFALFFVLLPIRLCNPRCVSVCQAPCLQAAYIFFRSVSLLLELPICFPRCVSDVKSYTIFLVFYSCLFSVQTAFLLFKLPICLFSYLSSHQAVYAGPVICLLSSCISALQLLLCCGMMVILPVCFSSCLPAAQAAFFLLDKLLICLTIWLSFKLNSACHHIIFSAPSPSVHSFSIFLYVIIL